MHCIFIPTPVLFCWYVYFRNFWKWHAWHTEQIFSPNKDICILLPVAAIGGYQLMAYHHDLFCPMQAKQS